MTCINMKYMIRNSSQDYCYLPAYFKDMQFLYVQEKKKKNKALEELCLSSYTSTLPT